jgi:hypothetical protein
MKQQSLFGTNLIVNYGADAGLPGASNRQGVLLKFHTQLRTNSSLTIARDLFDTGNHSCRRKLSK